MARATATATTTGNGKAPAAPKATRATAAAPAGPIAIQRIGRDRILVPITGTAPLISHAWDEKARRQMLDKQQGRRAMKTVRDPEADYQASIYRLAPGPKGQERYGFPSLGFKAATVGACRFYGKDVSMTATRMFLFFAGEWTPDHKNHLVEIIGEPAMREDVVRLPGTTGLAYRAEFREWSAVLDVTYVPSSLSKESVLALIDAGGMGIGVGDWRIERAGMSGTFAIDGPVVENP